MPRPERYMSRADLGWGTNRAGRADPQSGLVVHYDGSDQRLADKAHLACVAYWQATRRFHMGPSRGWVEVGYSYGACPHGYVLEGRGLLRAQAAQPGGNSTYYSVSLMSGPTDRITPEQINAVRQLREWLMEPETSIAGTVKGHRDFISTSCPGADAYALVRDGTFTRPATWGAATIRGEDDMPDWLNVRSGWLELEPGAERALTWEKVWTDEAGTVHQGGQALMTHAGHISGHAFAEFDGVAPGEDVQMRMVNYSRAAKTYKEHPISEGVGTEGKAFPTFPVIDRLGDGLNLDLRVKNTTGEPVRVRVVVKANVWKKG